MVEPPTKGKISVDIGQIKKKHNDIITEIFPVHGLSSWVKTTKSGSSASVEVTISNNE
jgi:hypothetical protein